MRTEFGVLTEFGKQSFIDFDLANAVPYVIAKVPLDFLKKAYFGLHDLDLELAVRKVGEE
ncbi:hypothetical protein [Bifidobacterium adolescentis]|uniref:hypothetical protein n=1 Tax=Bifidobacterium adolescentis TaxID=1680 RepID=UPI0040644D87